MSRRVEQEGEVEEESRRCEQKRRSTEKEERRALIRRKEMSVPIALMNFET